MAIPQTILPISINRKISEYPLVFDLSEPDRAYATYMNLLISEPFWEEVKVLEVLTDGQLHAMVIGYLVGSQIRKPYDMRSFIRRGTSWENLGNDRRDTLNEARQLFQRAQDRVIVLRRILEGAVPRPAEVCGSFKAVEGGVPVPGVAQCQEEKFKGLLVARLDEDWDRLVPVQPDATFTFPSVAPGRHRAVLFLAMNLRGKGVGTTEFEVRAGESPLPVEIQMEPLAEVQAVLTDEEGQPLVGLCLSATWRQDGNGLWVEGSYSDREGRCYLYLPLNERLFVRGRDGSGRRYMEPLEITATAAGRIDLGEVVVPRKKIIPRGE